MKRFADHNHRGTSEVWEEGQLSIEALPRGPLGRAVDRF
jgi:hypothetical protein